MRGGGVGAGEQRVEHVVVADLSVPEELGARAGGRVEDCGGAPPKLHLGGVAGCGRGTWTVPGSEHRSHLRQLDSGESEGLPGGPAGSHEQRY
ncbi:hypothetical protein PHK61_31430 [Actinomycetospora lutea]|nr:hypothetical protein [Actinomycetospora lutea]MDD7942931.1 hypothetical protein [Actinomycetospora lutea]